MRNINELIGIIKGISDDGAIDEREVTLLRTWVAQNRNLTFDPNQVKLLDLVDKVAADNKISSKERDELVRAASEYLAEGNTDVTYLYALNSIFDEIVSEQKIERSILRKIEKWTKAYYPICRERMYDAHFYFVLDGILDSGSVSSADYDFVRAFVTEKHKRAQLEAKISHLCKLVRERKNIGIELIEILDNTEAIDEINKRAERSLKSYLRSYSGIGSNLEIVFVSLVLIAMLNYDGNYYEYVRSEYADVYDG